MNEKKENKVVKIIGSLIAIVIMAILIFLTFNYYNDLAKNGNKSKQESNNKDTSVDEEKEEQKEILLTKYDKRTITVVNGNKITINIELTDGGNVLTLNGDPLTYIPYESEIEYATSNNTLVFAVSNPDSKKVIFADYNGQFIEEYGKVFDDEIEYTINDPYISLNLDSYIKLLGNNVYITFTRKIDDLNPKDIVQFTYKFNTSKKDFINNYEEVFKYTYEDYLDKR